MGLQRMKWQPTPVLLPGKSHGRKRLVGCSPWGREQWTRLSDFTFTFHFPSLEKEMATHSSVLAWRIQGRGSLVGCVCGVTQSRTRLKRLSHSSSSSSILWTYILLKRQIYWEFSPETYSPTSYMRHDWKSHKKNFFIIPKVSFFFTHLNALFQNVKIFSASIL